MRNPKKSYTVDKVVALPLRTWCHRYRDGSNRTRISRAKSETFWINFRIGWDGTKKKVFP